MKEAKKVLNMAINVNIPEDVVREQSKNITSLASPFVEGMEWIADKIRLSRQDVIAEILQKSRQICDDNNIEIQHLPNKFIIPFLEKGSQENPNSKMIDRWASLLSSSASKPENVHPAYIDILSQIDVNEALLLREIWKKTKDANINIFEVVFQHNPSANSERGWHKYDDVFGGIPQNGFLISSGSYRGDLPDFDGIRAKNIESLQILERQNLIKFRANQTTQLDGQQYFEVYAMITPLGYNFTESCEQYTPQKE